MDPLPFIPGQIYNRRADIHAKYGGNWQGGIAPSATHPYIFIFSGDSGKKHGYKDWWVNDHTFFYTGEGQVGDMKFIKGNLALKEHLNRGKRIFLFDFEKKGYVKFNDELEFYDVGYVEIPDNNGDLRIGIRFILLRKGAKIPYSADELNLGNSANIEEPATEYLTKLKLPNITERKGLVTSRVGQGIYRQSILHRWNFKCAVTGFDKIQILVASHILPWAEASHEQRLDVHNGILLSPTYDALFDRNLISFENSGKIILSDSIERKAFEKIGVYGSEKISDLSSYNLDYLQNHRNKLIVQTH